MSRLCWSIRGARAKSCGSVVFSRGLSMRHFCRGLLSKVSSEGTGRLVHSRSLFQEDPHPDGWGLIRLRHRPNIRIARLTCGLALAAIAGFGAPADWIWTGRYVVTMDAQRRVIENGAIAIVGDHVAAVGTRASIDRDWQPKQRLDRPDAILAPGLINTHTHAPMSLFRGIADDLKLQDWLEKFIFPAEKKNVDREFVRWGTRLACLEMALSGTTTYTDMYYFEDTVAAATKE